MAGLIKNLRFAFLAAAVVVAASACSAEVAEDPASQAPAATSSSTPQPATGPVKAEFGGVDAAIGGDLGTMAGAGNTQQCAVAVNLRVLCYSYGLDGTGADSLLFGGIHGFEQYRDPQALDKNPPAPLQGLPAEARIATVEPTDRGFVLAYGDGVHHALLHTDFNGATLWTLETGRVLDLTVTDTAVLVSTEAGMQAVDLGTGTASPASGSVLLGYSYSLSEYATYQPAAHGLSAADGGALVDPRPMYQKVLNDCLSADCREPAILLADAGHVLLRVTAADGSGEVQAYDAEGRLSWVLPGLPSTAAGFQGAYVFGFDDPAVGLLAVNAQTGTEIGKEALGGHGAQVLGVVEAGVLVRFGIDPVGSYDARTAVIPLTVTEGPLPAVTAPSPSAPGGEAGLPAGWTQYDAEGDPFSLDLPEGWSIAYAPGPGDPGPMRSTYVVKDAEGDESASIITGMSGLGGACPYFVSGPVPEATTALPHLNKVAKRVGTAPAYLETQRQDNGALSLAVTDRLPHPNICPLYTAAEIGGLGAVGFTGTVDPEEVGTAKEMQLRNVMLSLRRSES
ncbi:hypothetical protein LJ753_12085 [Arthrobacter sp. zg-Y20]|uniref:hypothetical protein n=1 Tax=unclassified Arthrobacter TaxID=235627 RepID=UPI001D15C449|nr:MULTISPECIES: hypothetical protein [unclassified Arthrobacter]MCC3276609.1 hypothetical protein [Arthrobacter sp. zg-Y20]MDK1316769.1 hypothetical protein [Arthrobacter sp. zg.Y20]WIB06815.1 hypothetical protein QNO06_03515 [Arthrobacter sp. zg-Y20]